MTQSKPIIEDLGVAARGDMWMDWRIGHDPEGNACFIAGLARGGFMLLDFATRYALQVQPQETLASGWGLCQSPDGHVWQTDMRRGGQGRLLHWDTHARQSRRMPDLPFANPMAIESLLDASLVCGPSHEPTLWRRGSDGAWSRFSQWSRGGGAKVLRRDRDGVLYALVSDQLDEVVLAIGPGGDAREIGRVPLTNPVDWHHVLKLDRDGVAHLHHPDTGRWWRLSADDAQAEPDMPCGLTRLMQWPCIGLKSTGVIAPLVHSDGARALSLHDRALTWRSSDGTLQHWDIPRVETPLRIFSVAAGFNRIWGGTFIPLTLFSYQPKSHAFEFLGNPTGTSSGEIYCIVAAEDRLLMGGYANASVTGFAPDQRWIDGQNPLDLGPVHERPRLHRPRSAAVDDRGFAYFAAHDSKGHGALSALARIAPLAGRMERWSLPEIELSAILCLDEPDTLLAAYRRGDDLCISTLHFAGRRIMETTILCRDRGSITAMLSLPDATCLLQHDYRARLIRFDPRKMQVVGRHIDLDVGDLCHNSLAWHPRGVVLGLSNRCVFSVDLEAAKSTVVANYEDHADGNFYRFGLPRGPDGRWYFANGPQLMRLTLE